MKQQDEEAWFGFGGLMLHGLARWKVNVCPRPDNLAIGLKPTIEDDDRMRGGVTVKTASHGRRIANEIVLFTGSRILVEEP